MSTESTFTYNPHVSAAQLAAKKPRKPPKGVAHTPSVDELYGPLVKAGMVRIVRKKGHAPVIVWL